MSRSTLIHSGIVNPAKPTLVKENSDLQDHITMDNYEEIASANPGPDDGQQTVEPDTGPSELESIIKLAGI